VTDPVPGGAEYVIHAGNRWAISPGGSLLWFATGFEGVAFKS